MQVLQLCRVAGLVRLGHVAIDGAKLKANASRHKAMSYGRMKQAEARLAAEVAGWLGEAERTDRAEDAEHGPARRGDEMPDWVADKQQRLERIRTATAAQEAEAAAPPAGTDPDGPGPSSGMQRSGRTDRAQDGGPPDRAQRNFTDPDSRILPTRDGFIAGYNAQVAVDATSQVIVSQRLITSGADVGGLVPLVDAVRATLGRKPVEVSADTGFASEANLTAMAERRIRAYVPPPWPRSADGKAPPEPQQPRMAAMADTLKRAGQPSRYRLRRQIVEPVFGQSSTHEGSGSSSRVD